MLPHINLRQALYRGEFVGCLALIDHRGPPIDMDIFPSLADERTWGAIRDAMVPAVDAHYQVYERNSSGEWSFNHDRFKLDLKRKTWDDQSRGHPQLENLRQLRHVRDKMRKV